MDVARVDGRVVHEVVVEAHRGAHRVWELIHVDDRAQAVGKAVGTRRESLALEGSDIQVGVNQV